MSRATRQFERLLGIDMDALRSDQRGSYDDTELARFREESRPHHPSEDGEVICTITYDHERGKVIYDFPDGRHIEE